MSLVKCKVSSCTYYEKGNCDAKEILVNNGIGSTAKTSKETICETFKPKGQ